MAKKRQAARKRAAKQAKPRARRRAPSQSLTPDETMNLIVALLVVALIGLGIYFYQINQKPAKTGMSAPPAQVAMAVE